MVEDSLDVLYNTPIEEYCANDMGYMQMLRYMNLNLEQLDVLALSFGTSVLNGENKVSDDIMFYDYRYANNINYLRRYQRRDADGVTNSVEQTSNSYGNYTGNNSLYSRRTNLYYDDNDTGENKFTNTQKTDRYIENQNPNSILSKTKQLFKDRKIRTIISRFRTDNEDDLANSFTESARSQFGLSHGRNLLTKDAESRNTPYHWNGYEDPYCRVWTHHHQYSDVRARLIRPFSIETEDGQMSTATSAMVNSWQNFEDVADVYDNFDGEYYNEPWFKEIGYKVGANIDWGDEGGKTQKAYQKKLKEVEKEKWGWRKKGAEGYKYSVLNSGVLNITPKYIKGAETNVHTKDCMFSIENLAWQGYDPYSFEKALSWEQRGPFGGRIMWFPPYGLAFNEETSANWNEQTFIGRGESVYTYANTNRTGTLRFTLVVDHPSIVDYATWDARNTEGTTANATDVAGTNDKILKDTDILRFFAGCDNPGGAAGSGGSGDENGMSGNNGVSSSNVGNNPSGGSPNSGGVLQSFAKPTPLTDEYMRKDTTPHKPIKENPKPETAPKKDETPPTPDDEVQISFYVFYPNNYSGAFDRDGGVVDPIAYLLAGKGAQWRCNDKDVMQSESLPIKFDTLDIGDQNLGNGYEMKSSGISYSEQESEKNYILGTTAWNTKSKYVPNPEMKWYYRIDGEYKKGLSYGEKKNCFGQKLPKDENRKDSVSFALNSDVSEVKSIFPNEANNENLYSLAQIAYALESVNLDDGAPETKIQQVIKQKSGANISASDDAMKRLIDLLKPNENSVYKLTKIGSVGFSNSHGVNTSNKTNDSRNNFLAAERCNTAFKWFTDTYKSKEHITHESVIENAKIRWAGGKDVDKQDIKDVNGLSAKKWRSAKVILKFTKSKTIKPEDLQPDPPKEEENVWTRFDGFVATGKTKNVNGKEVELFTNTNDDLDPTKRGRIWYYDDDSKEMILLEKSYATKPRYKEGDTASHSFNHIRYDQEYYFFKQLKEKDPMVFKALTKKLQYFDPAFHSMTPEGFNARLTFLQQCMRQGDTTSASDKNGRTANNLAFGKQPVCILRLGDFFYTKIIIRSINFDYEPLVLDLNQEGVGVQPMLCNVSLSFNIIGGADLTGPVRRLQNALSFNYYANSRLYDNRADRIERQRTNWETMGAMGNDKIDFEESKFNSVTKAKL